MTEATARKLIQAHFDASGVGAPGGAPGDDIARASEIYADDAVVEWPQGGERLRGKTARRSSASGSTSPSRGSGRRGAPTCLVERFDPHDRDSSV